MTFAAQARGALLAALVAASVAAPALAQNGAPAAPARGVRARTVRVVGIVRDETNAIALPGIPVQVAGTGHVVYTDVDGRYVLDLPPGSHRVKVAMEGYHEKTIDVRAGQERTITVDVGLTMAKYAETVTVTARAIDAQTSSAEAQLIERKQSQVITDNMGSTEMKANGDSDAASAMARVTGLSVVDNQYVFVRGLGERYSNTTLSGATIPTTEPDKKVVPLDLFPAGLLDSVQVSKSYSPDRSAEFAGGLVEIVPLKLPRRPVVDLSYGFAYFTQGTGDSIPLSPLGGRDWLGFDDGARALPEAFPASKIVRRGIYTPDVGFSRDEITAFGRLLDTSRWSPALEDGRPGQNWSATFGNRFDRLGVVASVHQSYKDTYVEENRRFFNLVEGGALDELTDYDFQTGTQKAQLGIVGNVAYQFTSNHRLSIENFYSHSGRDEGRIFEGANTDANFLYRNLRLSFIEEGLLSNAVGGEHFFQTWANSRIDWRVSASRASRDEPDLRETLYQAPLAGGTFRLADESQSGFRLFNTLDDETYDLVLNWSTYGTAADRPVQLKFGPALSWRTRDFASRRFRYIPTGLVSVDLALTPEQIFVPGNIGSAFRFNEETRPTDAYDAEQTTIAGYGMVDAVLSTNARLIAGVRAERFDLQVNTFDPFGLFVARESADLENTDVFPGVNFVYSLNPEQNLRLSYSQTVNRPEFRELAAFEFTDVVGNRAIRGNPNLTRALIQNVDARWELFAGSRGLIAGSAFFKHFEDPIERVINAGAQPLATFENADSARNFGFELEVARDVGRHFYFNANYTFVDSEVTLTDAARRVQTSQTRALAGQSDHLFNGMAEVSFGGFASRVLLNYAGDRIADVGQSGTPDIVEEGRTTLDFIAIQRLANRLTVRLTLENLTDEEYRFTQGPEDQRLFKLGRTVALSIGYSFF